MQGLQFLARNLLRSAHTIQEGIMMKRLLGMFLAVAALAGMSVTASAAVVTFTDRAGWEAATGIFTETATFPGIPQYQNVTALTLNGGTQLAFDSAVNKRTIGSGWATWSAGYAGDVFYSNGDTSIVATITEVSAFGLEMEPNPYGDYSMSLTLSDGSIITQTVSGYAGADFFGWVGAGVVSFTMASAVDFAFGRFVESQVPEPGALLLLGSALFGMAGIMRRRIRHTI
jgi:hypothetical protein